MYFVETLKVIATEMNLDFYVGDKMLQNLRDQVKKPMPLKTVCFMDFPFYGKTPRVKQGYGSTNYSFKLFIAKQSQIHWDMDQHLNLIKDMDDTSHSLMNRILKSGKFQSVDDLEIFPDINKFDSNLTGVILSVTLAPFDRRSNCG